MVTAKIDPTGFVVNVTQDGTGTQIVLECGVCDEIFAEWQVADPEAVPTTLRDLLVVAAAHQAGVHG